MTGAAAVADTDVELGTETESVFCLDPADTEPDLTGEDATVICSFRERLSDEMG